MKIIVTLVATLMIAVGLAGSGPTKSEAAAQKARVTIRIERFPRPPYSGATYYLYERDGEVICTKLEVCNKYDQCNTQYRKGRFKEEEDVETGEPYGKTDPVLIPMAKQRKHVCLTRFKLLN